jgi:hypothetical protein
MIFTHTFTADLHPKNYADHHHHLRELFNRSIIIIVTTSVGAAQPPS